MCAARARVGLSLCFALVLLCGVSPAEDWPQLKYDSRHSGNMPDRAIVTPLGLVGAVPLTDAILTAPVVRDERVYVVDGAGVVFCLDGSSLEVLWKFETAGGKANCNNTSSPALAGRFLHVGTMAGKYYVLDCAKGTVVKEIPCGEPILGAPVVVGERVYFATFGSKVYSLKPDGTIVWTWDFVEEVLKFSGNRWSGEEWLKHKQGRVTWRDQFLCTQDLAAQGDLIVLPVSGSALVLRDLGARAEVQMRKPIPSLNGSEYPALFGTSMAEDGTIFQQWHRRDNAGRVEIIKLPRRAAALQESKEAETSSVPDTETAIQLPRLLSFSSVSVRGSDVYRCSPEHGFGFCKHSLVGANNHPPVQVLNVDGSIASPVLLREHGVYGGLDGKLYVVPLSGKGGAWSFRTAFGKAITAPVAVCDGRIYFGCDDGYLYILGPNGKAKLPGQDLQLGKIRSPLTSERADAKYDWFTNYGNLANTNANDQDVKPPFKLKWVTRYEGTFKHIPICGGGRMYTHTAEGQIFALEQETGRLLWRGYWADVHLSFTSPIYCRRGGKELLLVPQGGIKRSLVRCLNAATGDLLWEAPFTGSPSWSRQGPPVIFENLAIYGFGSGRYAPQGTEQAYIFRAKPEPAPDGAEIMAWMYTHDNPYYPQDNKPFLRAWDLDSGKVVWEKDFSEFGRGGNDVGLCLMDGTLYYSTFFGYATQAKDGKPKAQGFTAALEPRTGHVIWQTTRYYVTAGCTMSGENGRLYLGGYNIPVADTKTRHVWCLDAKDGSLIWQSEPVAKAVNVVTVGPRFLFAHGSSGCPSYLIDKGTGKILTTFDLKYACTRFTLSEPYLVGCNLDLLDTTQGVRPVSSGPALEPRECVGAAVSNGRIFYTSQSSGVQACEVYGPEATQMRSSWE
jgi:outer membrane protein assembly factor BamB